ncbi:MAG: hypothetical protein AAGF11_51100 [Myxococcota bacterium]
MIVASLCLGLQVLAAPSVGLEVSTAGVAAVAPDDEPRFRVGLLSSLGVDAEALRDALALRLPALELRTQWSRAGGAGRVFISVRPTPDGAAVRTEVIADDGRGYSRRVDVPPDDARRIASVLANLLFSIEHQALEADVEDLEVPPTSAAEDVERAVSRLDGPATTDTPADTPAEMGVESEAEPEPVTEAPDATKAPGPPLPAPRWLVVVPLSGGVLLPVGGPRFGSLLQGGGLVLGADGEHRGGARFGLRVRYLAREDGGFRLSRLRVAVGAGYGWRIGRLDLPVRGELSLEPWWVVFEGERLSATSLDAPPSGTLALGGGLRFEPSVNLPLDAGALAALRVGLALGVAGSFVIDEGARVATITSGIEADDDRALFRVGGLEVWLGGHVSLVFGRPSR